MVPIYSEITLGQIQHKADTLYKEDTLYKADMDFASIHQFNGKLLVRSSILIIKIYLYNGDTFSGPKSDRFREIPLYLHC